MSAFDELTDIAPLQIWPGLIARALDGVEATLAAIELEPDVEVPEHSHVNEQIGILTGGSMTFRIGGEERELRPGATWNNPCARAALGSLGARRRDPDRGLRSGPSRLGRPRAARSARPKGPLAGYP
jgi:hypothetical protein